MPKYLGREEKENIYNFMWERAYNEIWNNVDPDVQKLARMGISHLVRGRVTFIVSHPVKDVLSDYGYFR